MANIKKFPKYKQYPTGSFEAYYDCGFGPGSWDELEAGVFARYPEFAPGGIYAREPKVVPQRKWWQFWKPQSNVVSLEDYK